MADRSGTKYRRLSVAEQPRNMLYEMSLRFTADAVPAQIADFMAQMGFHEMPVAPKAVTHRVTQVVPFIPDGPTLAKYAEALAQAGTDGLRLINVTFDGYDYIHPVVPVDEGRQTNGITEQTIERKD